MFKIKSVITKNEALVEMNVLSGAPHSWEELDTKYFWLCVA